MTPAEFRAIRNRLGLTVAELAAILGVHPIHVRRMEMDRSRKSGRAVPHVTALLMRAMERHGVPGPN